VVTLCMDLGIQIQFKMKVCTCAHNAHGPPKLYIYIIYRWFVPVVTMRMTLGFKIQNEGLYLWSQCTWYP